LAGKKIFQGVIQMSTSKPIIFIGPSLNHDKARKIFQADYRGPAKKGDLLMLSASTFSNSGKEPNAINFVGLVDGLFLQDYPPTPIEVYQLLSNKNFHVVGGASIGALRAMELEKFGMVGIGKIFELFRNGTTDADDEVAVTFHQGAGECIQSEAMVDIRFNLFVAFRKKIITERVKRIIARTAKSIYFPHRNYTDIVEQARSRFPELSKQLDSFSIYINENRLSLKEHDAIKVVEYIKEAYERDQNKS
jgi:TfuA protein